MSGSNDNPIIINISLSVIIVVVMQENLNSPNYERNDRILDIIIK